ncbi:BTB/POZ domain-containing protein 6-like [Porites lutea]|uniref:BTB/POZ domain-containing protein 6-like n=1 Tax=Porites lutea TaxID=51062 RepID=UPI003CC62001
MCEMADDHWQTKCLKISERTRFIFNNELLSDVKFIVPASNSESESRKMIPAHKFVLAIGSPVFYAMFFGEMAETKNSIELPDCEYESLLELFRYLYTDEVNLTGSNVMRVLYLAKKYMLPSLADKCGAYLQENLEASNVFSILPHAMKFDDQDLKNRCWKVIEKHTEEAVTSDEFVTLERSLVESVVKKKVLNVKEAELFKPVDRWASQEIERQGLNPDSETKRRIIGEELLNAIRFPLMSQKEFLSVVPNNILTTKEIFDLMKHYNGMLTSPLQFSASPRTRGVGTCHRFFSFGKPESSRWGYRGNRSDRICFTVNKDTHLIGVEHFSREGGTYTVRTQLIDTVSGSYVANKSEVFSSEEKHQAITKYYGFTVLFDDAVPIKENSCYEVVSLVNGNFSWFGGKGRSTVECFGVTFTFHNTEEKADNNGTDVHSGQFPVLLFEVDR